MNPCKHLTHLLLALHTPGVEGWWPSSSPRCRLPADPGPCLESRSPSRCKCCMCCSSGSCGDKQANMAYSQSVTACVGIILKYILTQLHHNHKRQHTRWPELTWCQRWLRSGRYRCSGTGCNPRPQSCVCTTRAPPGPQWWCCPLGYGCPPAGRQTPGSPGRGSLYLMSRKQVESFKLMQIDIRALFWWHFCGLFYPDLCWYI